MKPCKKCNETKTLDNFYFRLSDDKSRRYYWATCKKCHNAKIKGVVRKNKQKPTITCICFRCGLTTVNRRAKKYCSNVCRYEARSDLDKFKNELRIDRKPGYIGQTY